MRRFRVLLAPSILVMIAACGEGGYVGKSSNPSAVQSNPFANGAIPEEAEEVKVITAAPAGKQFYTFKLDPENGTYWFGSDDHDHIVSKGRYNPETGLLNSTLCDDVDPDDCYTGFHFKDLPVAEFFAKLEGSGLVLTGESRNGFPMLVGYNPTDLPEMPKAGNVRYVGDLNSTLSGTEGLEHSIYISEVEGKAVTNVDFGNENLGVEFSDLTGRLAGGSASIDDVAFVDGNKFMGGEMTLTLPDGQVVRAQQDAEGAYYVPSEFWNNGMFFGDEAEELGGVFVLGHVFDESGDALGWAGTWNGVAE